MYLDKQTLFSEKQAVTATTAATNTVDLGPGDAGPTSPLQLFVAASSYTGAGTLVVELQTAAVSDAAGVLTTPATVATFPVSNAALLAGGTVVAAQLPKGMQRYCTVKYTVTGTITGGAITSGLVLNV